MACTHMYLWMYICVRAQTTSQRDRYCDIQNESESSANFNSSLYQITAGTPLERFRFILQVAVGWDSWFRMYVCMHVCIYVRADYSTKHSGKDRLVGECVYAYVRMCMHAHAYVAAYTHVHIHMHIHIHIHAHTTGGRVRPQHTTILRIGQLAPKNYQPVIFRATQCIPKRHVTASHSRVLPATSTW